MRQLLPDPAAGVDPVALYLAAERRAPVDRPWVAVGMIQSLDGATAVAGRSGGLGGPSDTAVFRAVRAIADVILVGAGTVRGEDYGPVRLSDEIVAARVAAGRPAEPPRLAVVSASLDLDPTGRLFGGAGPPPLLLTTSSSPAARRGPLGDVAEIVECGTDHVDLAHGLRALRDRGATVVVSEGGPTLNGALVDAGVVDEWCVSLAPLVAGGDSRRLVHGAAPVADLAALHLDSLLEGDGVLFGRWLRDRGGPQG